MIKICPHCKEEFFTPASKTIYCSRKCYHEAMDTRSFVSCPVCGKKTKRPKCYINRVFCSRICYEKARKPELIKKICPVCNKEFFMPKRIADRYTVCSRKCRLAFTEYINCKRCGKHFVNKPGKHYSYCSELCRRPPVFITCKTCRKQFRKGPSDNDRKYCSFSCYIKDQPETSLEKTFRLALNRLAIPYIQEARVGRYSIDFVIKDTKIAIELDGTYWHRDDSRDKRKVMFLKKYGWTVIRFTEAEINNISDIDRFIIERLKQISGLDIVCRNPSLSDNK